MIYNFVKPTPCPRKFRDLERKGERFPLAKFLGT